MCLFTLASVERYKFLQIFNREATIQNLSGDIRVYGDKKRKANENKERRVSLYYSIKKISKIINYQQYTYFNKKGKSLIKKYHNFRIFLIVYI